MSINVNVTKKHLKGKEFPKLMISDIGQIVLAHGPVKNDGKLMKVSMLYDNGYPIGDSYTQAFRLESLSDFNGELTISNS